MTVAPSAIGAGTEIGRGYTLGDGSGCPTIGVHLTSPRPATTGRSWPKRWPRQKMGLQIVERNDVSRFEVVPRRWIVQRTSTWMSHFRRLARDFSAILEPWPLRPPRHNP